MASSSILTRKQNRVWLIGFPINALPGSKLPSWQEVLQRYFKLHVSEKMDIRSATTAVVRDVIKIWEKARIPTADERNILSKLDKKLKQYRSIMRGKSRRSAPQISREKQFKASLCDLFDIAHIRALDLITNPEDCEFLRAQREPGRRGFMAGVDKVLAAKEERILRKSELVRKRQQQEKEEQASREETVKFSLSDNSSGSGSDNHETFNVPPSKKKTPSRGHIADKSNIVTPAVTAALDRTKVSDRSAVHVLSAAASAMGLNPSTLSISRSSIRRSRRTQRKTIAEDIQASFVTNSCLVVHWDGKLLPDQENQKVDRLPVIVTDPQGSAKLLGVPKLNAGTGKATAAAITQCLEQWQLKDKVVGMSFDTTSSNTGAALGACTLLQQKLGRPLFHFACRHHILELVAEAAFVTCLGPATGPDIALFKRFQSDWNQVDQKQYKPMMVGDLDSEVSHAFFNCKDQVVQFCSQKLQLAQPRDDYRELLELTIILFGERPQRGIRFLRPGAMHRARWMARVIYSIKIYMFRDQFVLTRKELTGLKRFTAFVGALYIKAWFSATSATAAPATDLAFLKGLISYPDLDIAKATSKKFANHLWYLSEDLAGLALFDTTVELGTKRMIVAALKEDGQENPRPRAQVDLSVPEVINNKTVADFVTSTSMRVFGAFQLSTDFLEKDADEWGDDPTFQSAERILGGIATVNDFAERGVALIQSYNDVLTKDEQQRQYLLQVVEWHRRQFPNEKESDLKTANEKGLSTY